MALREVALEENNFSNAKPSERLGAFSIQKPQSMALH